MGRLQLPKSMQTVTAEDLCIYYCTQQRIPRHAGTSAGKGKCVSTLSSLAGIKFHLQFSTEFELLGRPEGWNADTLQGKGP